MNPPDMNDPLDVLLREQNTYIDDNGFTAHVIAALPKSRRRSWLRAAFLLGVTAVGYVLALWWMPWRLLLDASVLMSFNSQALLAYALLLVVGGSLLWGVMAALGWEE
jgi:hypothetical protein